MKMKQNDFLTYTWVLPLELRNELKDPLGAVLRPKTLEYQKVLANPPQRFICVGDIVTETFLAAGKLPWIIITDGITKREKIETRIFKDYKIIRVNNPAGRITSEAWKAVHESVSQKRLTHILVNGEEDLLTIPAIIEAPISTSIFYGQPNVGMVKVEVTLALKNNVLNLLSRFEKIVD